MRALIRLLAIAALILPQAALAIDPAKVPPITIGIGSTGDVSGTSVTAGGTTRTLGNWLPIFAPVANPTFTGVVTAPAQMIQGTGIQANFAGLNPYFNQIINLTARQASAPEVGAFFNTVSSVGGADPLNNYKMAWAAVCTANPGSASCWGGNVVVNLSPGAADNVSLVGFEIDVNNNARNCPSANSLVYPYCAGMIITGAPLNYANQAGIIVEGATPIWNYGIAFNSPSGATASTTSIKIADIYDNTGSTYILKSQGAHTSGIDLTAGTFITCTFTSANFCVSQSANVAAHSLTLSGNDGAVMSVSGAHTLGVDLSSGTYSAFAFRSPGFSVDSAGSVVAANFTTGGNLNVSGGIGSAGVQTGTLNVTGKAIIAKRTVGTSSTACTAGEMAFDSSYIYTCSATNSWNRLAAGASW